MEADNVNNIMMEIRSKERVFRRSKSRSMTPMIISNDNDVELFVINNISPKLATGRKSVGSTKSISKSKTYSTSTGKNTVIVTETHSSQEESRTVPKNIQEEVELVTQLVTQNENRPMELRSERHRGARHRNISVANGTGKEEAVVTTSMANSITTRAANKSTAHQRRTFPLQTSDYSSDDDDQDGEVRDNHSQRVLNVYQGEFWNKLPKTDFTYSPISKDHYKEVAPGVTVKPNMSRSTYQSYSGGNSFNTSASFVSPSSYTSSTRGLHSSKTTSSVTTESNKRSRFFDASKAGSRVPAYINAYASPDSDEDEVETRVQAAVAASTVRQQSFVTYFTSFFSMIWTFITTTCTTTVETTKRVLGLQTDSARYGYSTPVRKQESHSHSWWRRMVGLCYVLPALATGIDLGLLSSFSEGSRAKRLRLFSGLLFLLLLLLCGWLLYFLVPEETVSHTSVLLSETQAAVSNWFGMFGEWFRKLGGWILLLFAAKEMQQNDQMTSMRVDEYETLTIATSTLHTTPPTTYDINILIEQILTSQQFEQFMESKLGKFDRDDLIKEILVNNHFTNWMALKFNEKEIDVEALTLKILANGRFGQAVEASQKPVDVNLLAADIWDSGQLQQFIDAYLNERKQIWLFAQAEYEEKTKHREEMNIELMKASLQQELNDKSKYFEIHNTKLADEIVRLKVDIEKKLNASVTELKGKLSEELTNSDELKRAHDEEIRLLKMHLKKCCNKAAPALPMKDIEKYVLQYMAGLYGIANKESVSYAEMQALMGNLFIGRQQFEAALANVTAHHKAEMKEVSEQSAQILMETISERISEEFATHQKLNLAAAATSSFHHSDGGSPTFLASSAAGLTDSQVVDIVNKALMRYDADKTGMVDYALESSGGSIINTRCTESYYKHSASMTLFGIPYWYPSNTPRTVIQPGVHPGECWAFRGSQGFLVIQLAGLVRISSFSLEHIPRSLAFNGNIDSAPKDFSVWGLEKENDPEPTELGKYTYLKNSTSLQYFIVKRSDVQPFKIIELRIESNHGNLEYTCLYRFRVHGTWVSY